MRYRQRWPDDFHLHVRQGAMISAVLPHTMRQFARALIMPNTVPPIVTGGDCDRYLQEIQQTAWDCGVGHFQPLMTVNIVQRMTPDVIRAARACGAVAGKVYPRGVTTNSLDGVEDWSALAPVFDVMQGLGMVLCLHGEEPSAFCLDREEKFLPRLKQLASDFPRLRIVLEHVTTAAAVEVVCQLPDTVAATITAHHLCLTLDDVIGSEIMPHFFCKPVPKRAEDRSALWIAAMSGNPKLFFGSDSAPGLRERKECASGCAGVFTAPVAMPLLANIFSMCEALNRLENFTARFGAEFYQLPLNESAIELEKRSWKVPQEYSGIVPFLAGSSLNWQIV